MHSRGVTVVLTKGVYCRCSVSSAVAACDESASMCKAMTTLSSLPHNASRRRVPSNVWRVSRKGKVQKFESGQTQSAGHSSERYGKKRVHYNNNPISRSRWEAPALEGIRTLLAILKHIQHGTSSLKIPNPVRCV